MSRTIKIIVMLLVLLGASSEIAFSKDPIKIDAGTLEISNITVESGKSAVIFNGIGDLTELIGPESGNILKEHLGVMDGYVPIKGFAAVGDKVYGLTRKKLVIAKKEYFFIKINCTVNNISESAQTFRIGDLRLQDTETKTDFLAVGPKNLPFRVHSDEDYQKMADVIYNLEPNASNHFSYVFIANKAKRPWTLSYKEQTSAELGIKIK